MRSQNNIITTHPESYAISLCPALMATAMAFGDGIQDFSKAARICLSIFAVHILYRLIKSHFKVALPFKDLIAFLICGPLIVMGTYYYQSYEMNHAIILSSLIPGLLCASRVNLLSLTKTIEKRRSLGAKWGEEAQKLIIALMLCLSFLLPVIIYILIRDHLYIITNALILILIIPVFYKIFSLSEPAVYTATARYLQWLLILFSLIYSLAWIF